MLTDVSLDPLMDTYRMRLLLTLAKLSYTHWFFGNLYEEVTRMPERLVDEHNSVLHQPKGRLLAPGSPLRYYLPGIPLVVGTILVALVGSKKNSRNRSPMIVITICSALGAILSGYLIRSVNLRLLNGGPIIGPGERRQLVTRWHRVNRLRLALIGAALAALEIVSSRR